MILFHTFFSEAKHPLANCHKEMRQLPLNCTEESDLRALDRNMARLTPRYEKIVSFLGTYINGLADTMPLSTVLLNTLKYVDTDEMRIRIARFICLECWKNRHPKYPLCEEDIRPLFSCFSDTAISIQLAQLLEPHLPSDSNERMRIWSLISGCICPVAEPNVSKIYPSAPLITCDPCLSADISEDMAHYALDHRKHDMLFGPMYLAIKRKRGDQLLPDDWPDEPIVEDDEYSMILDELCKTSPREVDRSLCGKCHLRRRAVLMLPCSHITDCVTCARQALAQTPRCSICNTRVTHTRPVSIQ